MSEQSMTTTYRVERVETEVGTFVEVYDSDYSDEEPAAFLSAADAVEMANTILDEFGASDSQ